MAGKTKSGAHVIGKLTEGHVKRMTKAGMHADGGGLYLNITATGAKSWIFRFSRKLGGDKPVTREIGLGPTHTLTLADARAKATEMRKLLLEGIDPLVHRQESQRAVLHERMQQAMAAKVTGMTFDRCAEKYIETMKVQWTNPKHAQQWTNTLTTYASPHIGNMPVADIDVHHISELLTHDGFWTSKTETASRVRQRVEKVLDWAKVQKYRKGENPARLAGNLEHILPAASKIQKKRHHPALPYAQLAEFLVDLRQHTGMGAKALEFQILTCVRPGEAQSATWNEVDLKAKVWTIPAARMKIKDAGDFRVPLTPRAVELLKTLKGDEDKPVGFIFKGNKPGQPVSEATAKKSVLDINERRRDAGLPLWVDPKEDNRQVVPHGFRASFSTWAAEATNIPSDIREACLAHKTGNDVIDAYQRGDLFNKRCDAMNQWAGFCEGVKA